MGVCSSTKHEASEGESAGESEDESVQDSQTDSDAEVEGGDNPGEKVPCYARLEACLHEKMGFGGFRRKGELQAAAPQPTLHFKSYAVENAGKKVTDYFDLHRKKVLGTGGFATVCSATDKKSGHLRAVKCILKTRIPDEDRMKKEIEAMMSMDHPNIVKLFQTFEDNQQIYLVMELCAGGELFDVIVDQGRMSEADAAIIMKQIFRAVVYMHEAGICHRDLKPENFLFLAKSPIRDNTLKIVDFGIAGHFQAGEAAMTSKLGTPYYVAPEVLSRWARYDEKCDCWSCGVIMYVLLSGILPFKGSSDAATLQKVLTGKYSFPPELFDPVSEDAKELIRNLLQKSPSQRHSAKEALKDAWIANTAPKMSAPLSKAVLTNLRAFSAENRLKKAALQVVAWNQEGNIMEQLRDKFLELDSDGDGILTLQELKNGMSNAGLSGLIKPEELEALMIGIDADGSGQIDYTEFLAATLERREVVKEAEIWAAFRVFDKNDDGKISQQELQEVLRSQEVISQEQIDRILAEVDLNGDGAIDFQEFVTMMKG